jgi:hypothetical protein
MRNDSLRRFDKPFDRSANSISCTRRAQATIASQRRIAIAVTSAVFSAGRVSNTRIEPLRLSKRNRNSPQAKVIRMEVGGIYRWCREGEKHSAGRTIKTLRTVKSEAS